MPEGLSAAAAAIEEECLVCAWFGPAVAFWTSRDDMLARRLQQQYAAHLARADHVTTPGESA